MTAETIKIKKVEDFSKIPPDCVTRDYLMEIKERLELITWLEPIGKPKKNFLETLRRDGEMIIQAFYNLDFLDPYRIRGEIRDIHSSIALKLDFDYTRYNRLLKRNQM